MARITVEDCLEHVENRFELVMLATKRSRQLATGGKDPLVKEDSDKPTVIALREIAEGLVKDDIFNTPVIEEEFSEFEETPADAESLLSDAETEVKAGEEAPANEAAGEETENPADSAEDKAESQA